MHSIAQTAPPGGVETRDLSQRRASAIRGAFFSEAIDMFDIYLPAVVLTPVLFLFHPQSMSSSAEAILSSLVFITTLIGRPVGALLFGIIADRTGRRAASISSVAGFGLFTLLIALLPGYEQIGVASYWLLIALRFLDGICLGGGYTGAIPLAFEYSEKHRRGFTGGYIMTGFPVAYVAINLVAMAVFHFAPLAGPGSPYAVWGWRIPFVIGAALAGLLMLYYVFKVSESEIWKAETGPAIEKMPLNSLLRGSGLRAILQVVLLMTGFWLTQNLITIFLPTMLLPRFLHITGLGLTATLLPSYLALIVSYLVAGLIGQKIGRRRFFMIAGMLIATIGAGLMYLLVTDQGLSQTKITYLVMAMSILVTSPWGMIITYINERFATDVRATGFGAGFSLSVILPSLYAFYMNFLGNFMPFPLTAVVLLAVGGLIGMIGAAIGPETNDVNF